MKIYLSKILIQNKKNLQEKRENLSGESQSELIRQLNSFKIRKFIISMIFKRYKMMIETRAKFEIYYAIII